MTLTTRFQKLTRQIRERGLGSLPRWAWRWVYWNTGLHRLRGSSPAWPPALDERLRRRTSLPVCDDLSAWCAQQPGATYQVLTGRQRLQRHPPRTAGLPVDASFQSLLDLETPERALVSIPGARVVGPNGLVVLPDGQFVGELIALTPTGRRSMLSGEPAFTQPVPAAGQRLPGHYGLLSVLGWPNYYHWNHDVIMRMATVMAHLPPDLRFLVPAGLKPFHYDSLSLLGIDRERLVFFDGQRPVEVEHLWVSTPIHKTQITSPAYAAWYRQAAVARWGGGAAAPHRRIYLTRPADLDTHYRVTNDAEVRQSLDRYGFEVCQPHTLSLGEQVRLFAEAKVIVGTGTGLMNMVFAPPGAQILQFQEPGKIVHALWTLSEALGHEYWYLLGETVPNPDARESLPDIHVPMEQLTATLDHMLAPAEAAAVGGAAHP